MTILARLPKREGRRPRRRRLRSLAIAPTLMTLGNLLCGFAAIHLALQAMYGLGEENVGVSTAGGRAPLLEHSPAWFVSVGAILVLVGGVFDFFDGLIARVTRTASEFGGELDSLADAITFGVAPATLMVAFISLELTTEAILPSPMSEHLIGRAIWLSAAMYVAFAAVRLARFNVEHAKVDFDYRMFRGLPTPGAACVVVALILFQDQMGVTGRAVTVYSMPFVAVALAFLMVSRIPYRRFHRAYFLGEKPFSQVMTFVALVAVFWLIKVPTLLLLVLWYAASGPLFTFFRILRDQRRAVTGVDRVEAEEEAEERKLA